MSFSPLINELVESLTILPGVGRKSAQRMALQLLERNRAGGLRLSAALSRAMDGIVRCRCCQNFAESDYCPVCLTDRRDAEQVCVVETPSDLAAIESAGGFKGRYFVLMGHLSPIDGIGPDEIGLTILAKQVAEGHIKEVILATNSTVEGEATAYFIAQMLANTSALVTRIAHGIPLGGELGYIDGGTLSHAFSGRKPVSND